MARPKGRRQQKKANSFVIAAFVSPGQVHAAFALSLAANAVEEKRLQGFTQGSSARINKARNEIIKNFLEAPPEYEWYWMVDADMVIPPDALTTLLKTAESKQRRIVGGLGYIFRPDEAPPYLASIMHKTTEEAIEGKTFSGDWQEQFIINEPPRKRLIEATSTGFFCVIVHRSILEAVYEEYKHLNMPWINEVDNGVEVGPQGPDVEFFERALKATGENPLIDTSVQCGHIKEITITHELALQYYHGKDWEKFLGHSDE